MIGYINSHLGLFLVFTSLCVLKDQSKSPLPSAILIVLVITLKTGGIVGFVFRESVVFRGARARDGEICNIRWKEIDDADSSTGLDVLERKREGSAIWGREFVSFKGED